MPVCLPPLTRTITPGSTDTLWTFTIVTRAASKSMAWLHDRQPVVLRDAAALALWLDTARGTWTPALSALCAPQPEELPLAWSVRPASFPHSECTQLTTDTRGDSYQVPKEVGRVGAESPAFVQPIAGRSDGIQALFARQSAAAAAASPTAKRSPSPDASRAAKKAKRSPERKLRDGDSDSDSDVEIVSPVRRFPPRPPPVTGRRSPGSRGSAAVPVEEKARTPSKGDRLSPALPAPSVGLTAFRVCSIYQAKQSHKVRAGSRRHLVAAGTPTSSSPRTRKRLLPAPQRRPRRSRLSSPRSSRSVGRDPHALNHLYYTSRISWISHAHTTTGTSFRGVLFSAPRRVGAN